MASPAYNFPPYHNEDNSGVVNLVGGTVGSGAIPKGSASSGITFGKGFPNSATTKQTVLPVITAFGTIVGFFPITSTTFTGAERVFALASGILIAAALLLPHGTLPSLALALALAILAVLVFNRIALRKIGGHTGDTIGATAS